MSVLALLLLALFIGLAMRLHHAAPQVYVMESWRHGPAPNGVTVGRDALGQNAGPRSAEEAHLTFRQDGQKEWWIRNIAHTRKAYVTYREGGGRDLSWWSLKPGDRLRLDGVEVTVRQANGQHLALADAEGRTLLWRDGSVTFGPEENLSPLCSWGWKRELKRWFGWRTRHIHLPGLKLGDRKAFHLFYLGGALADPLLPGRFMNCPDLWSLRGVTNGAAEVVWWNNAFWLTRSKQGTVLQVRRAEERSFQTMDQLETPLTGDDGTIDGVIVGRTLYRVYADHDQIRLKAEKNRDVARQADAVHQKSWHWMAEGNGLFSLGIQWGHALLAWLMATLVLARAGWLKGVGGWLWLAAMAQAGIGTLTVSQLAVGATNTAWLQDAVKHLLSVATCGWLVIVTVFLTRWSRYGERADRIMVAFLWLLRIGLMMAILYPSSQVFLGSMAASSHFWLFILLAGVIFALTFLLRRPAALVNVGMGAYGILLAAQALVGKEEGVFGIQPAEGAKFVLVLLAGQAVALYHFRAEVEPSSRRFHILKVIYWLGVIGLVATLYAGTLQDWSPALLLCFFIFVILWKMAVPPPDKEEPRRRAGSMGHFFLASWHQSFRIHPVGWSVRLIVLVGFFLTLCLLPVLRENPQWLFSLMDSVSVRERLEVWSQPELFSQSGHQLLAGMQRVGEGGWLGVGDGRMAERWFGANGDINQLPKVHNDFIAAFVLHRFGWLLGLFLLAIQWWYISLFFVLSGHALRWGQSGTARQYLLGHTFSVTLFGLAWMHLGQWLIAWSNPLGLLPVMGQPMTWLSMANSHLVFFAFPSLLLALVAAQGREENLTCSTR